MLALLLMKASKAVGLHRRGKRGFPLLSSSQPNLRVTPRLPLPEKERARNDKRLLRSAFRPRARPRCSPFPGGNPPSHSLRTVLDALQWEVLSHQWGEASNESCGTGRRNASDTVADGASLHRPMRNTTAVPACAALSVKAKLRRGRHRDTEAHRPRHCAPNAWLRPVKCEAFPGLNPGNRSAISRGKAKHAGRFNSAPSPPAMAGDPWRDFVGMTRVDRNDVV